MATPGLLKSALGGANGGGKGKKMVPAPFLTPAKTKILMLLSASVESIGVSCMLDFLFFLLTGQAPVFKMKVFFREGLGCMKSFPLVGYAAT